MHGSLPLSFRASMFRLCVRCSDLRCVAPYKLNPKLNNNISPQLENTRKELIFLTLHSSLRSVWRTDLSYILFFYASKTLLCNIPEAGEHYRIQRITHKMCACEREIVGGTKSFGRRFGRVTSYTLVSRCVCEIKRSGLSLYCSRTSSMGPFWSQRNTAQRRQMTFTSVWVPPVSFILDHFSA